MVFNGELPAPFITMASEPIGPRPAVHTVGGSFHFTEENQLLFQAMYDKLDKMLQTFERRKKSFKPAKTHAQIAAELRQRRRKAREVAAKELNDDALNVYDLFDEMPDSDEDLLNVYHMFDVMPLNEIEVCGEVGEVTKEELEADSFCIHNLFDETPLNQNEICGKIFEVINDEKYEDSFGIHMLFDETPMNQIEDRWEVCDTLNELEEDHFGLSYLFDEMPEGEIKRYDTVYDISQLFEEMPQREIRKYEEFYIVYHLLDEIIGKGMDSDNSRRNLVDDEFEKKSGRNNGGMPLAYTHLFDPGGSIGNERTTVMFLAYNSENYVKLLQYSIIRDTRICDDICEIVNKEYREDGLDVYTRFAELPDCEVSMYDEVFEVRNEKLKDANEIHQVLEERDKQCTKIETYSRITDEYVYHLSHFDKSSLRPDDLFMEPALGDIVGYGKLAKHDLRYCVYIPTHDFENSLLNYSCTQNGVGDNGRDAWASFSDTMSSSYTVSHMFLTEQSIANDWKMNCKLLIVIRGLFPDSENAFSDSVSCILDWSRSSKLYSVMINPSLTAAAVDNLRALLFVPSVLNEQLLVGNHAFCSASHVVQDALSYAKGSVKKVRNIVKGGKTIETREEKFLDLKVYFHEPTSKTLAIADLTRWTTTHEMFFAVSAVIREILGWPEILLRKYSMKEPIHIITKMAAANGVSRIWVGLNGLMSTSAVSVVIRERVGADGSKVNGSFVLTASHNPGGADEDFGVKYNMENGGPAPEGITDKIYANTTTIKEYFIAEGLLDVDISTAGVTSFGGPKRQFDVDVFDSASDISLNFDWKNYIAANGSVAGKEKFHIDDKVAYLNVAFVPKDQHRSNFSHMGCYYVAYTPLNFGGYLLICRIQNILVHPEYHLIFQGNITSTNDGGGLFHQDDRVSWLFYIEQCSANHNGDGNFNMIGILVSLEDKTVKRRE